MRGCNPQRSKAHTRHDISFAQGMETAVGIFASRDGAERARGGKPATTPGGDPQTPRVLRFDFPDYDKGLQPVSWEAWFKVFEERGLVFLFQQHLKSGKQSNFFRVDSPQRENA